MLRKKEIITAVGTLGIAAGIGFVMQSGDAAKERYGAAGRPMAASAATPDVPVADTASANIFLEVEEVELTSASDGGISWAQGQDQSEQHAAAAADLPNLDLETLPTTGANAQDCAMTAMAKPVAGAIVELTMAAPCAINERLTVHHNGMMFTTSTDATGTVNVNVPALAENAVFILAFANGEGAVAQAQVADLDKYDRVAVQWRGQAGFQLHAREFGADYGTAGHIWSGATSDIAGLINGDHGYLMQLGDVTIAEPLMAEVYSFPSGGAAQQGAIDLSVEAEVTKINCGQHIEAQTIEVTGKRKLKTRDLTLSVPDCDAVGSFLVLNNLVSDLKVAGN